MGPGSLPKLEWSQTNPPYQCVGYCYHSFRQCVLSMCSVAALRQAPPMEGRQQLPPGIHSDADSRFLTGSRCGTQSSHSHGALKEEHEDRLREGQTLGSGRSFGGLRARRSFPNAGPGAPCPCHDPPSLWAGDTGLGEMAPGLGLARACAAPTVPAALLGQHAQAFQG